MVLMSAKTNGMAEGALLPDSRPAATCLRRTGRESVISSVAGMNAQVAAGG